VNGGVVGCRSAVSLHTMHFRVKQSQFNECLWLSVAEKVRIDELRVMVKET
jgi:hypothetical protein